MVGALGLRALAALTATVALAGAPATARADSRHCFEPPPVKASGSGLQLTRVASAGTTTGVANAPGDPGRVYLSQRTGTVLALDPATGALRTFLDLSAEVAPTIEPAGNERGMQSIAFAPDYRTSRRLYVFYSDRKGDSRVDEFKATPDFQRADMATRRHVLLVRHSFSKQHYGGQLAFGSKHRLFVSLGEAEHARWAQRRRLYGELVSLDPLHARAGVRVIAKGFRNPFHFTFDPFTGSAVIADVGETSREEIDVLPRSRFGRANFGWPYFEGNRRLFPWRHRKNYMRPALVYDHKVGAAVIGGTFIRDPRLPKLRGRYLYADLCDGWLALGRLHRRKPTTRLTGIVASAPSAIGEDGQHRIYIGGRDGAVYRLDPAPRATQANFQACVEPPQPQLDAPGLHLTELHSSAGELTALAAAPGQPGTLYVVERRGVAWAMDSTTGAFAARPFLDLQDRVLTNEGKLDNERGMMSLAFAPDYATSRLLYVFYTDRRGDSRVVELKATPDGASVLPGSARSLLRVAHSFSTQHFGGQLAFGPHGGRLYVSLGDATNWGWAQRRRLYGHIISLRPARPHRSLRVLAKGMRNPYRFSFDSFTGDLIVGDVGETKFEEVDVIDPNRKSVANLGWPYLEAGFRRYKGNPKHLLRPAIVYSHENGTAVVGGFAMRDARLPALRRRYVYGDYCNGWIAVADLHRRHPATRKTGLVVPLITSFGQDGAGRIYVATRPGSVYRLDPAAPSGSRSR